MGTRISGVVFIIIGIFLLSAFGVGANTIATVCTVIFFIMLIAGMMICGKFYPGSVAIFAVMLYIARLTISRINRPVGDEIASEYYRIISNDWTHLACAAFLLAAGWWLFDSLRTNKDKLPLITVKPVELNKEV